MTREVSVTRNTQETQIVLRLDLAAGASELAVDHGFLAHLLDQLARHGGVALQLNASGDVDAVDVHHLAEDVGIALGMAYHEALGDRRGIRRYAHAYVPMDETLARCVVDVSGRPYLHFDPAGFEGDAHGFNVHHLREFLRGFCNHARMTVHVEVLSGVETHHVAEAVMKAFARALRQAVEVVEDGVPSTKGIL